MRSTWIWPWYKVACPFCFTRFHPADAPLRPLTVAPGEEVPDEKVAAYFGLPAPVPMPPVREEPRRPWYRRWWLNNDWVRTHERVCPECHLPLSLALATGRVGTESIALIGDTHSGKSTYFGVLIHQLLHGRLAQEVGLSVLPQDTFHPATRRRVSSHQLYEEWYGERLFGPARSTPAATRGHLHEEVKPPLIYRLQFAERPWWSPARLLGRPNALDLVFFDTAGEDLRDDRALERHYRFLSQVRGLILLIDPLGLPSIREALPAELRAGLPEHLPTRLDNILDALVNLLERFGDIRAGHAITIPVAITLAKTDMLRRLLPEKSPLFNRRMHSGGFDREDAREVHEHVRQWLLARGQGSLVQVLRRFPRSTFCGVSALGSQPQPGERVAFSRGAYRVADPLFWVLHELGYLRARG